MKGLPLAKQPLAVVSGWSSYCFGFGTSSTRIGPVVGIAPRAAVGPSTIGCSAATSTWKAIKPACACGGSAPAGSVAAIATRPLTTELAVVAAVERISYASASLKINVALAELPSFRALPGTAPGPQHRGTIHI